MRGIRGSGTYHCSAGPDAVMQACRENEENAGKRQEGDHTQGGQSQRTLFPNRDQPENGLDGQD